MDLQEAKMVVGLAAEPRVESMAEEVTEVC